MNVVITTANKVVGVLIENIEDALAHLSELDFVGK
jgi:hypothetical protein